MLYVKGCCFLNSLCRSLVSLILYKAKWAWLILLLYVHVFSSMKIQECMPMYNANFGEDIKEIKHFSLHTPAYAVEL